MLITRRGTGKRRLEYKYIAMRIFAKTSRYASPEQIFPSVAKISFLDLSDGRRMEGGSDQARKEDSERKKGRCSFLRNLHELFITRFALGSCTSLRAETVTWLILVQRQTYNWRVPIDILIYLRGTLQ